MEVTNLKVFAYYLPQFHPCKANDDFWEEGFTDWVTTYGATPLFDGHIQPITSTELGRYDLTDPDVIRKQVELAKKNGVDGFSIYHYWFGKGDRALEKPIELLRKNKDIEIEYYISWVNCNWTKSWVGNDDIIIRKQSYDNELYDELMYDAIEHFKEERYVKINGNPLFYIHSPRSFEVKNFMDKFTKLAQEHGFSRIIWLAPEIHVSEKQKNLFDFLLGYPPGDYNSLVRKIKFRLWSKIGRISPRLQTIKPLFKFFKLIDYAEYVDSYTSHVNKRINIESRYIPTVMQSWDSSPRYKYRSFVYINATPNENYRLYKEIFSIAKKNKSPFVLIKAWNEWAEGNVLEPDSIYGMERLKALKKAREDNNF